MDLAEFKTLPLEDQQRHIAELSKRVDLSKPVTHGELAKLLEWLGSEVVSTVATTAERITRAFAPKLKATEDRLVVLESRLGLVEAAQSKSLHWQGVYVDGMQCEPGALVTTRGSLWVCTKSTDVRPGDDRGECWKLVAKGNR